MKKGEIEFEKVKGGIVLKWICSEYQMPCEVCTKSKKFGCGVENDGKIVSSKIIKEVKK